MTPKAQEFIARMTAWAAGRDGIRLIMVVGSQARDDVPADEFSDVDVVMAVDCPEDYLTRTEWLSEIGDPIVTFVEATAVGGQWERRVLFGCGLDVDFTIVAVEWLRALASGDLPQEVAGVFARGARLLIDKDGLGAAVLSRVPVNPPPIPAWSPDAFLERTSDFLYHSLWTARKAARGELFVALQCLDGLLRPSLFELARQHLLLREGPGAAPWYGTRMIERWASPDLVAQLAETCAPHDRESVFVAVKRGMALYRQLGQDLAAGLGVPFPTKAESRVGELIEQAVRPL